MHSKEKGTTNSYEKIVLFLHPTPQNEDYITGKRSSKCVVKYFNRK